MRIAVFASALLGATGLAHAGTITVTHGDVAANAVTCTLAQAIDAANRANNPNGLYGSSPPGASTVDPLQYSATREIGSGSCIGATGSFADPEANTIVFAAELAGATLSFATADNVWYGPNALPPIASAIVIDGGEAGITLLNTHPARLRFFFVGADATAVRTIGYNTPGAGSLTLRRMHLRGGRQLGGHGSDGSGGRGGGGAGLGGAIYNQGTLLVASSTLADNSAVGGNGGSSAANSGTGGGLGGVSMGGPVPLGSGDPGGDAAGTLGGSGNNGGGRGGNGDSQSSGATTSGAGGGGGGFGGGSGGLGSDGSASGIGPSGGAFGSAGLTAGGGAGNVGGAGGGVGGGGSGGGGSPVLTANTNGGGGGRGGFGGGGGGGGANTSFPGGNGGGGGFGGGGAGAGLRGGASNASAGTGGFGAGNGSTGGQSSIFTPNGGGGGAGLGGAIFNHAGQVTLDQTTLSGNLAQGGLRGQAEAGDGRGLGGAVFNLDGELVLNHVTAAANTADEGGAIYNRNESATASLTMQRSLVADSSATGDIVALGPAIGDSLVENPVGISPLPLDGINGNRIGVDPQLGVLGANGGPTPTQVPAASSIAIDATPCADPAGSDQRGIARPVGVSCDYGAVEFLPPGTLGVGVTGEGTVSAAALPAPVSGGIVACAASGGACQAVYAVGATVTLQAMPALGHHLDAWGGDCAAAGSALQADVQTDTVQRTCSAAFVRNPPGSVGFGVLPALEIGEGSGGSTTITIPLTLSESTAETVTVAYTLVPASGSAGQAGSDFVSAASGSVDIVPGALDATLVLAIAPDTTVEPDEAFDLAFSVSSTLPGEPGQANATLSPQVADGLLLQLQDDDSAELALPDLSQPEAAGAMSFLLSLSAPVQGGLAVGYFTVDGSASSGSDYTETDGVLLHDGSTTAAYPIEVPILDDNQHENDEHFDLRLDANCMFSLCAVLLVDGRGTIENDDAPEPDPEIFRDGFESD